MSTILSAAVFIAMEIAALVMISHNGQLQRTLIASVGHSFMSAVWGFSDKISDYFCLRSQNEQLSRENFNLSLELAKYRIQNETSDNKEISALTSSTDEFSYIPAKIVKMAHNSQHNYFIIDKGYEDGVKVQDGVITSKGALGIVDAVHAHYSFCLSFLNSSLSISARLKRNGTVAPLVWNGKNSRGAILQEIPLQVRFIKGDTVWTSGFSAIFPPNIPLGVTGKAKIINGSVNEIQVELFEDFSALKYVTVSSNNDREEIEMLEKEEEER